MRTRALASALGLALATDVAPAQFGPQPAQPPQPAYPLSPPSTGSQPAGLPSAPPPQTPRAPFFPPRTPDSRVPAPGEPRFLPIGPGMSPPLGPSPLAQPRDLVQPQPLQGPSETESPVPRVDPSVKLPHPENLLAIDAATLTVRRATGAWELWAGRTLLRDFGPADRDAEEMLRAMRSMRPTEWGRIGSPRTVVEYGLTSGEPPKMHANARTAEPIDRKTVRAESVRGAWVLRDDANILLNFGSAKADAEQAVAVVRRYGFNRLGLVGVPTPSAAYFYSAPEIPGHVEKETPNAALIRAAQEQSLTRTGVDVPGVGYVGEQVAIDPLKLEVKKVQNEWVLLHGPDVLGRFGYSELTARDALRVVKDGRFTQFCRVGSPGVTFFLVNGQPPKKVPFDVQGMRFEPADVRARETVPGVWAVCDATGRTVLPAAGKDDAELVAGVIRAFKFDQLCKVGQSPKAQMTFFARVGR